MLLRCRNLNISHLMIFAFLIVTHWVKSNVSAAIKYIFVFFQGIHSRTNPGFTFDEFSHFPIRKIHSSIAAFECQYKRFQGPWSFHFLHFTFFTGVIFLWATLSDFGSQISL